MNTTEHSLGYTDGKAESITYREYNDIYYNELK